MGWAKTLIGLLLLAIAVALAYHYRSDLSGPIVEWENEIAGLGRWAPLAYLGMFILLTSLFFPDSVLSALAGALFGTLVGFSVVLTGALVAQSLAFWLSRRFLQPLVLRAIANRPKFNAIRQAADQQGLRLQFLLRLTPLNPVLVSHVVGTTDTRFGSFLLGCLGLIPALFVQVYLGFAAKHMIKAAAQEQGHSVAETGVVVVGLITCLLLFILVTRAARKAMAQAELQPEQSR
jgi:uncharacterized membrane protein YdjX (TVP38/TMEM64 family)